MTFSPFSSQCSPVCIFAARTGHPDRGPSRQTTTDRQLVCVPAKSQMSFASVFAHRVLLLLRDWCCVCVCFMPCVLGYSTVCRTGKTATGHTALHST